MKPGSEGSVELAIDSIQFGAPSSAGSTDSDGVPALLETGSENKLPAPKEQRQKQNRAGPIKTQKVTALEETVFKVGLQISIFQSLEQLQLNDNGLSLLLSFLKWNHWKQRSTNQVPLVKSGL